MPEAAAAVRALLAALLLWGLAATFLSPRRAAAGAALFGLLVASSPSGLLLLESRADASALGLGLAFPLAALAPSPWVAAGGAAAVAASLSGLAGGGWLFLLALPGALLAARAAGPGTVRAGALLLTAAGSAALAVSWSGSPAGARAAPPSTAMAFPVPPVPSGGLPEVAREGWARTLRTARGEDLLGNGREPGSGALFRFGRLWEALTPFLSTLALGGALSLSAMTFLRPRGRRAPAPAHFASALLCLVYVLVLLVGGFAGNAPTRGAGPVTALPLLAGVLFALGGRRIPRRR